MSEKLVYVKPFSNIKENIHEYKLYFSEKPDIVWGIDWDIYGPVNCSDLTPEETTISSVEIVRLSLPLKTVSEISEYSMEYCTYGMIALSWIDIENLEEYPENGRCVLHFGEDKENINKIIEPYKIK